MILQKSFYIMRHGESIDNALGRISGAGSNPDLTLKGYKQAEIASLSFLRLDPQPTAIIASGLDRTHQTALTVIGPLAFIKDADLNERHLGDHDGKLDTGLQKKMTPLPREENQSDHAKRVVASINRHLKNNVVPLFVCHAGTIRRVLESTGLQNTIEVGNGEIFYFLPVEMKWRVSLM